MKDSIHLTSTNMDNITEKNICSVKTVCTDIYEMQLLIHASHTMFNKHRADSRLAPSQWETSLQSNAVSHWLGANLESALKHIPSHISIWYKQVNENMMTYLWHQVLELRHSLDEVCSDSVGGRVQCLRGQVHHKGFHSHTCNHKNPPSVI